MGLREIYTIFKMVLVVYTNILFQKNNPNRFWLGFINRWAREDLIE
jgi:hypothetical protein